MATEDVCPEKSRTDLEWDRLLGALANRCASAPGRRAALSLPFFETRDAALEGLAEVKEAVDLDIFGEPIPARSLPDVEAGIERARIGAPLDADELRAIGALLTAARDLRHFFKTHRERAERLAIACSTDPTLDRLEHQIASTFEPDGTISDRASPELASFRSERRTVRDRLVKKLEELAQRHSDVLQDGYWTERDGRYVLPVRADAHERVVGIVHAASGSGATVFVEPRAVVELGNRIKMLDAQIERVERAILAALSADVGERAEDVSNAVEALAHADVRAAAAHLARDLRLTFPDVEPEDAPLFIGLRGAKHPLLQLDGVDVVPSDLEVCANGAVIVSGPNAGGKTVALKTLGLSALMLRAGLPIPAREGSRVSFVEVVLTDVGDDQNLHKNLSTFSAHVRNLARILDETRPGALVLLDELAGGTDPREGEALAASVLDSLASRGGAVACTTHYEGLKALALRDTRFRNASVGFDLATMSPTFRLHLGVPGPSSALAVARRFGIPEIIVGRAEKLLSKDTIAFEEMVQSLVAERAALAEARDLAEREVAALKQKKEDLDREIERVRAKDARSVNRESEDLLRGLKTARDELSRAQATLRSRPSAEDVRNAGRAIEAVARKVAIGGELSPEKAPPPAENSAIAIKPGARVYVTKLRTQAEVIEVSASGQVRVRAGSMTLTAKLDEIRPVGAPEPAKPPRPPKKKATIEFDAAADPDVPIQTSENTVDLRGLRAHEAEAMAEQFLDRMTGSGKRVAFLIHGHGTGALRETIRGTVRSSAYVARSRPGEPREGGDGVTVVWLR